jgi:NAD(P)-dependent dehydrogenase (short-subunit alcohol dehydrogenase family)/acyl carrier protein
LSAVLAGGQEDMLAWRRGSRYTARLRADSAPPGARLALADDATYLITGGTGGLGLRLTHWLIEHGARHIALVGRRPAPTTLPQGARFLRADVSSERETAGVLDEVRGSMPPLRGIFHLAGTLDDGLLESQDWVRFAKSAAGKMDGAWNLHRATLGDPLDYFVMFSSMASLVPMPGQGSYAAANSALDALAWMRRAEGRPALSINWGPWAEIGHAATEYGRSAHAKLAQLGIEALAPDVALAALERLMAAGEAQVAITRVDWDRFFRFDPAARDSAFLSEMGDARIPAARPTELTDHMRAMPSADRKPFLIEYLAGLVRQALRLKESTPIPPRQGLFDLGLDSIVALELKTRLESGLGCPLRATLLFAYPNLESLAGYLLTEALTFPPEPEPEEAPVPESLSEDELAALIAEEIERRP